ncbi:MAG: cache domain-containing protein, partial [Deltaproteobacteria bacterium]|nr:cache domain-containing protein [Deltaproteobacteria bacterium]
MVIERVRNSIFKNSGVWFAAFCFFFLVVGGISYSVVNQLKVKADENITELLMLSLKASHAELEDWVQNTHNDIRDIVDDPLIGGKIQKLISREGKGVSNAGSEGVLEVRALLRRHIEEHGDRDFFVVSKERKNIASMRDVDLGRKDLFEGFEDGLERVFNGETIITHFARSSDKSPAEKKDNGYVMFAGTPVYNDDGDIAAAFLVTMDPETSLKNIIDIARIFKMGDAYFFNDQGMLVTESMYEGILREAGVIKEGEGAIFNVRLIDPRTDLRFTGHGALELDKLPLTKMAESALKGNSGINISGYRDYIGAVVVGAWLWENSAELGIAVEAEVKDAYASFYTLRDIVVL